MKLIDTDAEIVKIEEEIQRLRKAIMRWKSRHFEGSSLYDIDAKIRELQNNITDCKREIRILRSYEEAYDVDKVVEQLTKKLVEASSGMAEANQSVCGTQEAEFYGEKCAYEKAIEIVKGCGKNEDN